MANAAITVDLNAKIAQFESEMKRATGSLDRFEKKGSQVATNLKSAFGGFAAALSVGAIAAFAKSGIDAADALNDMSQRLGVSVKDLASFKLAAEQSGTSLDGVGTGIARLTRSIGEAEGGNKKLAQALKDLGITARDPKEAFFQLADAVKTIEDPSKRAALLSQVLGKSYQDLVPLLAQGGDELSKSAAASESFAESMAKLAPEADKFNDQLALLKQNAAGAAASILGELVPSFNEWIAVGREVVETGTLLDKVRFFGLGNASDDMVNRVRIMSSATAGWADSLKKSAGSLGSIKSPQNETKTPNKSSGGGAKSDPQGAFIDKLRQEANTLGLTGEALQRYEAAKLKLTGSNKKLADSYIAQIAAFKSQQEAAKANNDAFDEALKQQDELDAALEGSIKSVREWIAEQEFEVTLIGLTNTERESAIQLRALETAGIDTQTEAYRQLAEQVAAANSDKRGISILSGTQTEKTKEFMSDIDSLNKLFFDGKIGAQQYSEGIDLITVSADKAAVEMDEFAKNAAKSVQGLFSDFFKNFDKDNDNMRQKFAETVKGLIAEAASAQLTRALFGGLADGGKTSGSGWAGDALKLLGSFASFDGGGSTGSGPRTGGIDGKGGFLSVLHPKETVVDHTKGQRTGGSTTIVVNVSGSSNAPDVRRAAAQGAREAMGMMSAAKRYA